MKNEKTYYCVCRCTPSEGIVSIDARLLTRELLPMSMDYVRSCRNLRGKAYKALVLGDLCANAGYPNTALRVMRSTMSYIKMKDYDWVCRPINPSFNRLENIVNMYEVRELGRRIDRLWRWLGHPEMAHSARRVERYYDDLWFDKYYEALP